MKNQFLIFFIALLSLGCTKDDSDCGATGYPPPRLFLNLVDETTGENLLTNGAWNLDDVTITTSSSTLPVSFNTLTVSGVQMLQFYLPYEHGDYSYVFKNNGETVFTLNFDIVTQEMKCYTETSVENVQVTNAGFELLGNNEVKILVR